MSELVPENLGHCLAASLARARLMRPPESHCRAARVVALLHRASGEGGGVWDVMANKLPALINNNIWHSHHGNVFVVHSRAVVTPFCPDSQDMGMMSWGFAGCPVCCIHASSEQGEVTRARHLEGPCGHCSWGRSFVALVKVLIQIKPRKQCDTSTHLTFSSHQNREVPKFTWNVISFPGQLFFLKFHKHAALLRLTKEFAFLRAVIKNFHSVYKRNRRVVTGDPTSCHSHAWVTDLHWSLAKLFSWRYWTRIVTFSWCAIGVYWWQVSSLRTTAVKGPVSWFSSTQKPKS